MPKARKRGFCFQAIEGKVFKTPLVPKEERLQMMALGPFGLKEKTDKEVLALCMKKWREAVRDAGRYRRRKIKNRVDTPAP